jgi:hypothetical protein
VLRGRIETRIRATTKESRSVTGFHDLTMNSITGEPVNFELYKGHVCMVVNVASR